LVTKGFCFSLKHKVSTDWIWQFNHSSAHAYKRAKGIPEIKQTQDSKNKEDCKWVWCLSSFPTEDNR
jgi:predicted secreted protein